LRKKKVPENYEKRMKEIELTRETVPTAACSTKPTGVIVQPTLASIGRQGVNWLCHSKFWGTTPNHV
jgi:hypothetical protein